jgi:hypothetical protein
LLLAVAVPILSLICLAIVKKACSTFEAFLAEVSRKGMPRLSANSYAQYQHSVFLDPQPVTQSVVDGEDKTHLGNGVFNNFLVRHIAFVSNQQLVHTLCGISVNLLQPLLDIVERVHVRDIVNDTDAMRAAIVG